LETINCQLANRQLIGAKKDQFLSIIMPVCLRSSISQH
jgi:hypothetical protein